MKKWAVEFRALVTRQLQDSGRLLRKRTGRISEATT
jgi:hypothetical protein